MKLWERRDGLTETSYTGWGERERERRRERQAKTDRQTYGQTDRHAHTHAVKQTDRDINKQADVVT